MDGEPGSTLKENVTREAVVVVIDDDASVRAALKDLFESVGLVVKLYASGSAFQEDRLPDAASCLVLDVRLPEIEWHQNSREPIESWRFLACRCQLSALTSSASASIAAGVMTKVSDALLLPRHVVLSLVLPPRRNTAPGPKARSKPWSAGFLGER